MNVKFKIIETDLSQHSIVVRYYTDYFTEDNLARSAKQAAPYDWFKLRYDVLDPNVDTSLSAVDSLLGKEFTAEKPIPIPIPVQKEQITEDQIEALIRNLTSNVT